MFGAFLSFAQGIGNAMSVDAEANQSARAFDREIKNAEKNAELARAAGIYNAARQQDRVYQAIGTQRADAGATGTEQSSGNILDLLRQSQTNAEMDRLAILHESDLQRQNYLNQASGLRADRSAMLRTANKKKWAGILGGVAQGVARMPSSGGETTSDPAPKFNPTGSGRGQGRTTGRGAYMSGETF